MCPDHQHILLNAFADELVSQGVTNACTSPGSRSAPLMIALTSTNGLNCFSRIDERSSGFFALGQAKATGLPSALICTSGTAVAELAPAVYEAYEASIPMIILTADRPPELRSIGAGQTIDQLKIFGTAAKWSFEVGTIDSPAITERWIRTLAARAFTTATAGRPGPVHLNFPLREPLIPSKNLPRVANNLEARPIRIDIPGISTLDADTVVSIHKLLNESSRALIIAGEARATDTNAVATFALKQSLPILADPLSGLRSHPNAVGHYDALLRSASFTDQFPPDLIIRVGDLPTSKPLRQWLRTVKCEQLAFDPYNALQDPDCVSTVKLTCPLLEAVDLLPTLNERTDTQPWLEMWLRTDQLVFEAYESKLVGELTEPAVALELSRLNPNNTVVFSASSMPIRDLEAFWPARNPLPPVLANRGANGIDGTVASALGVASSMPDRQSVLLIGDVAFAYDHSSLIAAKTLDIPLTVVLINNDGGGIFDFLPIGKLDERFQEHVITQPELDFEIAAQLYGFDYQLVEDAEQLQSALTNSVNERTQIILEVRTVRSENVELHQQLNAVATEAIP